MLASSEQGGRRAGAPGAVSAEPTDQELIAGVRRRDELALGAIYDRYHRLVYTIALRITGEPCCAEEVVQDVFHAAWRSAGSFVPGSSLAAWLVGISRHRAIDATRAHMFRVRAREAALDEQRVAQVGDSESDLLQRQVVRTAIGALTPAQRQAIELAYYGGLTDAQIALRLDIPVGTVKSRLRVGLIRLRDLLRRSDGEE